MSFYVVVNMILLLVLQRNS